MKTSKEVREKSTVQSIDQNKKDEIKKCKNVTYSSIFSVATFIATYIICILNIAINNLIIKFFASLIIFAISYIMSYYFVRKAKKECGKKHFNSEVILVFQNLGESFGYLNPILLFLCILSENLKLLNEKYNVIITSIALFIILIFAVCYAIKSVRKSINDNKDTGNDNFDA